MSNCGWPEWLGLIAGGARSMAATRAGLAWMLRQIFRPWMRNELRGGNEALYARLKSNDFRHMEDAVKAIGGRGDRINGRLRKAL